MGITCLLPFLDKASERINISKLANKSVAIDSYCWLHKGAFAVGDKLARGEETDVHIKYCIKFVDMLLSHNIKPILVFDGRHLPAKAETEAKRRESRQKARSLAVELMRKGKHKEAYKHLRRCVDITHEMALQLIKTCRAMNVDCIVAPYEADAQLAYLNKIGLADYVITEDSDLTLFGCRKILFKLDLTGNCVLVDAEKLHLAMDCRLDKFTMDKFRLMCILSGCDYIDSLPGIGLAKSCKFVMMTEETDLLRALDKIPAYLGMRQLTVTEEYKINVLKARATFLHMVVFDPRRRKQVRLNEIEELGTDVEYCSNAGEILDDKTALNLAVGNLNPFTLKKLDDWHPDQRERSKAPANMSKKGLKVAKHPSIWHRDYRWITSLNGTATSTATAVKPPKTVIKKSPKAPKRFIDKLIESDDESLPTEKQNDDLVLNQYIGFDEPSQKRFKEGEDIDEESDEETLKNGGVDMADETSVKEQITPNRNPFKKATSCKDEMLSPTRITKENNSLVKTQSPVKHIDYGKLEKLSRFSRTVITSKQPVVSRFFNTVSKESEGQRVTKTDSGIQEDLSTKSDSKSKTDSNPQMKSPNLLDSYMNSPKSSLYFTKSNLTSPNPKDKSEEKIQLVNDPVEIDLDVVLSTESQRSILDKFKFALKNKIDEADSDPIELSSSQRTSEKTDSESNGITIVSSGDDDDDVGYNESVSSQGSNKRMWLSSSQPTKSSTKSTKKPVQRKKSTSSNKSSIKSNADSAQSRLSMFGFQKKRQCQP